MTTVLTPRRRVDLAGVDTATLLRLLDAHDLRGHGGGAFPAAAKIRSAVGRRPKLIVNLCDGEPLVHKDGTLLAYAPHLVLDGAALVARIVGAREVLLAAHRGSATLARAASLLSSDAARLRRARTLEVPDRYVSSESSALASLAAGGAARPVTTWAPLSQGGPGPGQVPVLVFNAETLARVAALWLDHTDGRSDSAPHRLVTVAGAVPQPGVYEVPTGWTAARVVEHAGGPTEPPRGVLLGGYAGTWLAWPRTPVTTLRRADLAATGADLGAGLVYVLGRECPLRFVGSVLDYLASESAGQCGPCLFGLPGIARDWAELAPPATGPAALDRLTRRLPVVAGRGACRHPDGAVRQAATALALFRPHVTDHWSGHCDAADPVAPRRALAVAR